MPFAVRALEKKRREEKSSQPLKKNCFASTNLLALFFSHLQKSFSFTFIIIFFTVAPRFWCNLFVFFCHAFFLIVCFFLNILGAFQNKFIRQKKCNKLVRYGGILGIFHFVGDFLLLLLR